MIIIPSNCASAIPTDPNWANVTLSLKDIGVNGATNSSFRDDGPFNFLPTRNGDVTQGTFSPFGALTGAADPYASTGSVYFDGTGDYIVPGSGSAAFGFGTGDFTIEMWIYPTTSSGSRIIYDSSSLGAAASWNPYIFLGGNGNLYFLANGTFLISSATGAIKANEWSHIAVSKASGSTKMFVNGVQVGSTYADTNTYLTPGANRPRIGANGNADDTSNFVGYISNFRVLKGTGLYTAAFTPSAAPLTAITNTSALTAQSSTTITDASTNALTVTSYGDARANPVSPFGYGSAYFDGTGDGLSTTGSGFAFGTGDFTVEAWIYPTATTLYRCIITSRATSNSGSAVFFGLDNGTMYPTLYGSFTSSIPVSLNAWNHVALVRNGSTATIYVNGISGGSATVSANFSDTTCSIGYDLNTGQANTFYGYISNFRVVKGNAVYTAPFTPPTAPLTAISGTSLLTCQDKGRIVDASSNSFAITRAGDVRPVGETPFAQKGDGRWSAYFDGSGDLLSGTATSATQVGSGDFTTEAWFYLTSLATGSCIYVQQNGGVNSSADLSYGIFVAASTGVVTAVLASGGSRFDFYSSIPVTTGRWYHVALVRTTATIKLYIDGVHVGSSTNLGGTPLNASGNDYIGAYVNSTDSQYTSGYISNFRIVKGTAVYTSAFTPPAAPLTAIAGTSLLACQDNRFKDNSPNNFTITKNGDVSVSRFNPFGSSGVVATTNLASTGSVYFGSGANYMTYTNNTAFNIPADFTIEFWLNPTSGMSDGAGIIGHRREGSFADYSDWVIRVQTSAGKIGFGNQISGGYYDMGPVSYGAWSHYAVTRSGSTVRTFCNGVLINTYTDTGNYSAAATLLIGENAGNGLYYKGYISDLRIVKGSAVYTAAFTPPTSPLTAISGTSLLLGQSAAAITDASSNAFTPTMNGSVVANEASPFKRVTYPYGGSAYFDGTGDWLTVKDNPSLRFGTGDFTIEYWMNGAAVPSGNVFIMDKGEGGTGSFRIQANSGQTTMLIGGTALVYVNPASYVGSWYHVAFVRSGTTLSAYLNGVKASTATNSTDMSSTSDLTVGGTASGTTPMNGYLSNVRLVKGSALYTANFTPPVEPVKAVGGTSLLLNFDNAGVYDSSGSTDLVTAGTSYVSRTQAKFDGSSTYLSSASASSSIVSPKSAGFRTGDFTIEMWIYPTQLSGVQFLFDYRNTGPGSGFLLLESNLANLRYGDSYIAGNPNISLNTWNHIALSRNSGVSKLFCNGTQVGSNYSDTNVYTNPASPVWGNANGGSQVFVGYMDDMRITNSARYTSNFTVPAASFPTSSQ